MITKLLGTLNTIPHITTNLKKLTNTIKRINNHTIKAQTSKRKHNKNNKIEKRITTLIDVNIIQLPSDETKKQPPTNKTK